MDLSALNEKAQFIYENLRLKTFPAAAKFLGNKEDIPEKAKRPSTFLKKKITICQGVTMARNYGWQVALTKEDLVCIPAMLAFGMTPALNVSEELSDLFCKVNFKSDKEQSLGEVNDMCALEKDELSVLLLSPLHKMQLYADTIVVYGNPAQLSRLILAATFNSSGRIHSSFGGKVECSEYLIRPFKTGEARVVIPGLGDRIFSATMDDEIVFAFPFSMLEELVEGLKESGKKIGARYPITSYQNFQPQFPKVYEELGEKLGISQ